MSNSKVLSIRPLGFPWETMDPFLFCVHHKDDYPSGNADMSPNASLEGRNIGQDFTIKDGWRMYHGQQIPGFPYHPHRGFETVTITETGLIDHADSMGAAGRFGNGDVQWMTAGKGVQHSEMFPMLNQESGNPLEFFQLWLNLPRAKKLVEPHFDMIWAEEVPIILKEDEQGKRISIRVIAGSLQGATAPSIAPDSWASVSDNEVAIWTIKMEAGSEWQLPKAEGHVNRMLYFYRGGHMDLEGSLIQEYHSARLNASESLKLKAGDQDAAMLILQGKPIGEPVAQQGPFVMNTKEEIQEAFSEYRRTEFGGWPWPMRETVHNRDKGRFALYADGKEEKKS